MAFLEVKGMLAKCLATENLIIHHDAKAETAAFNTATRILTLPVLNINDEHVYNLFVAHEASHALYTPNEWASMDINVPHDYINVIEDARIERMIQDKFPGLKTDFSRGYDYLNEKDFFAIDGRDLGEMKLIDRINLHFKLGVRALVPFNDKEQSLVDAVRECETFDDVLHIAQLVAALEQAEAQDKPDNTNAKQSPDAEDIDDSDRDGERDPEPNLDGKARAEAPEGSETQQAMDKNLKRASNNTGTLTTYLTMPQDVTLDHVVSLDEFRASMAESIEEYQRTLPIHLDIVDQLYDTFMVGIKRDVSFMAQQFEMRKAADAYARQAVHKTGVLDTNNLHLYKLTDDIFLRQTVTPDGKNHGVVMLLDWSGSMSDICEETVKQIIVLTQFCRKVGVDFDVYAFTCRGYGLPVDVDINGYEDGEIITNGSNVIHVLSSTAKRAALERDMRNLFYEACHCGRRNAPHSHLMSMGGTPLNNVLFLVPEMLRQHKERTGAQRVSFVCLTDGESSPIHYVGNYHTYGGLKTRAIMNTQGGTLLMRDGCRTHQIDTQHNNETAGIVSYLKQACPDVTFTHLYLGGCKTCSSYARVYYGQQMNEYQYRKEDAVMLAKPRGWDMVAFVNPRAFRDHDDELKVEAGASRGQIRSALKRLLKSKSQSKLLLSQLVEQLA